MSSERAGTPTHGTLNREQARHVLARYLLMTEGHKTPDQALDALEACVVPDPRLARIEKSCDIADGNALAAPGVLSTEVVRAILRGDQ